MVSNAEEELLTFYTLNSAVLQHDMVYMHTIIYGRAQIGR